MKFQDKSITTNSDKNTGSCAKLVEYLKHEDKERLELGKEVLPFFTPDGIKVTDAEVINRIDRNISGLCKKDTKFYHIVAAFSEEENKAMGSTEEELTISAMEFAKQISNAYAKNFHKEGIDDADDVLIYWKIHFCRDDNDIGQMHLHAIVSHKDKHNKLRISPCTNHKSTGNGPITGGFDRTEMCQTCETLFDMTYNYNRSKSNSFGYYNALKNGSIEEKSEALAAKIEEETAGLNPAGNTLLNSFRKNSVKKSNGDCEDPEIEEIINSIEIEEQIVCVFNQSKNVSDIKMGLWKLGRTLRIIKDNEGNVIDFKIIHNDIADNASEFFSEESVNLLFNKWEALTGQKSKAKADALKIAEAEKAKQYMYKNNITQTPRIKR